jgi:hypothetical protein
MSFYFETGIPATLETHNFVCRPSIEVRSKAKDPYSLPFINDDALPSSLIDSIANLE